MTVAEGGVPETSEELPLNSAATVHRGYGHLANAMEWAWRIARFSLAAGACAAAAYVITGTAFTAFEDRTRIIFWDMWQWIITLREWLQSGFTWSSLFAPTAEHRIVVARLFFFLDYLIDRQNSGSLIAIILAQCVAVAWILLTLFRRAAAGDAGWLATITFAAFAGVLLFAGANLESLQFGYQVAYMWAFFSMPAAALTIVLSLEADSRGDGRRSALWIAVCIFLCVVATYSNAGGLLVWPFILFLGAISGVRLAHLAAIGIFAAFFVGTYFVDYHPEGPRSDPVLAVFLPEIYTLYLPMFFANLLMPAAMVAITKQAINPFGWYVIAGWLGLFAAAAATWLWANSVVERRQWRPARYALFAIMLYGVATALMIVLARQNWGWTIGWVDRYRTVSDQFWLAALMFFASFAFDAARERRTILFTVGTVMAIFLIATVNHQRGAVDFYKDRSQRWQVTADAFRTGVMEWQAFTVVNGYAGPGLLPLIEFLRDRRLSVFADRFFERMHTRLDAGLVRGISAGCRGQVDEISAPPGIKDAWRLSGLVPDVHEWQSPHRILVVNNTTAEVVGLGTGALYLVDMPGRPFRAFDNHDGWDAYVSADAGTALTVYGAASDGTPQFCIGQTRLSVASPVRN